MPDSQQNKVSLGVGGLEFSGWQDVTITRSIEVIAGDFDLQLTQRPGASNTPFFDGDACRVKIGDDVVITGYLDTHNPDIAPDAHSIQATGRDATGDLVDCSAVHSPGEWRDRTALQIVSALCVKFSINVSATADTGKAFASFKLQEGETAFEAIDRICKARALLPVSDAQGGLVLMRSGKEAPRIDAPLIEGENIERASGFFSMIDRYSQVTVKGQQPQLDGMTPDEASEPSGTASDPTVKRYRPLIIVADNENDGLTLNERALWEVSVRAGQSRRAEITVSGWRNSTGKLWAPNTIVPVHAPTIFVDQDMLITTVRHRLSEDEGTVTVLSLADPQSFNLVAIDETQKKGGTGGASDALIGTPKYVGSELVKEGR